VRIFSLLEFVYANINLFSYLEEKVHVVLLDVNGISLLLLALFSHEVKIIAEEVM